MKLLDLFEVATFGSGGPRRGDPHGISDPDTKRYGPRTEPFHPDELEKLKQIVTACRRHGATRVVLFGSRARDDWRPDSDFDIYAKGGDHDAMAAELGDVDIMDHPSVMRGWPQIVLYGASRGKTRMP